MTRVARVALVWAQAHGGVIGARGTMPWQLPEDLAHFKELTLGHTVVMGRRTWESLPARFRPLPGRRNLVLTRGGAIEGAQVVRSLPEAVAAAGDDELWVMGGAEVYAATIDMADRLEVTEIDLDVAGDAFAPAIGPMWRGRPGEWLTSRTGLRYRFVTYERAADTPA